MSHTVSSERTSRLPPLPACILSQQAVSIFYLRKREAPLGARPKAGTSLASPMSGPAYY